MNIQDWAKAKSKTKRGNCRYCQSEILSDIIVCPICKHYQHRFRNLLAPSVSSVMVLVAFAQLILASVKTVDTYQLQNKVDSTLTKVEQKEADITARLLALSGNLQSLENETYELAALFVNISLAFWDINSLRYLAEAIKNPNYRHAKLMNRAKEYYDDIRKRIRDRKYADYDDPEYCALNADLLRQGKKDELLYQLKG